MPTPSQDLALYKNDLYIVDGDFAIALSDQQHVSDTIAAAPNWWKENPADGVNILLYLNSSGQDQELTRAMKIQLQSDGYKVTNPQVNISTAGLMIVNPNAEKL